MEATKWRIGPVLGYLILLANSNFPHIFYFRNQPASGFGFIIMSKYGNPLFQFFNIFRIKRTSGFGFSKIWKELSALIKELTVQGKFFHPV